MLDRYPRTVTLSDGTVLTLRPLVPEDEDALVALFADISEDDMRFLRDNVADPNIVRNWCRNINYDRVLPLIAQTPDGALVADGTLHRRPVGPQRNIGQLRFYVRPEYRRRGVARALLDELKGLGCEAGLDKLVLEVFSDDLGVIATGERLGFTREAILPVYQTVVLSLPLERFARPAVVSPAFRDHLPPMEQWPGRIYMLPEYANYPEYFNPTAELLDRQVTAGRGDRTAVHFGEQRITYSTLLEQAKCFANGLRNLGLKEDERVILRVPNIPPALVANFAALRLGAVVVPTSPLFSRTEIAHVAADADARVIVVHAGLLGEVEAARDRLGSVRHVVVVGGDAAEMAARGYRVYDDLLKAGASEMEPVKKSRADVAVLLYTSGTTGLPKGTAHLMEELLAVPDSFGKYGWRVTPDDVVGGTAPLAFGAGYSTLATVPFHFGAAASLIARFDPEKMFETIEKHRITVLSLPPTAYRKMLQVPDAEKRWDLSSLRVCTGGGESLTAQTYYDWKRKFGIDIYEGFGTTEMMYVFISNVVNMKARPGSFGQVVPGYEAKVVNEEGGECAPGEIGRLIARGPTGTLYWHASDKQESVLFNGWNRVGDFVYRDADGYFWSVSREDDVIKTSGYRVGPEEIEQALVEHPAVADAGVIGIPDPVRGQATKAFVLLKPGYQPGDAIQDELLEHCRKLIAVYKLPRVVEFVESVPRTPTGKLLRRVLRAREAEKAAE